MIYKYVILFIIKNSCSRFTFILNKIAQIFVILCNNLLPNQDFEHMQSSTIDCICFLIVIPINAKSATTQRICNQDKS